MDVKNESSLQLRSFTVIYKVDTANSNDLKNKKPFWLNKAWNSIFFKENSFAILFDW